MKIAKFLSVGLLSTFLLTACGGGTASFREDLSYERVLDNSEKYLLIAKVKESYKKLTKYEYHAESYQKGSLNEVEEKDETRREFFTNGEYKEYVKTYEKSIHGDVKFETTYERDTKAAFLEEGRYVRLSEEKGARDSYSCAVYGVPETGHYYESMNNYFAQLQNLNAVQRSEGKYFFFASGHNESYQGIAWGQGESKTYHVITKEQVVAELNDDYTLKSFTRYTSTETNRDPDTNEYKDPGDLTKTSEGKMWVDFSYGERSAAPSEVREAVNKYNNEVALGDLSIVAARYNVGEAVTPTDNRATFDYIDLNRKSHSNYHVTAYLGNLALFVDSYNGFSLNYSAQLRKGDAEANLSEGQFDLSQIANDVNQLQLTSDNKVAYFKGDNTKYINITLEFDMDVSSGVAQVLNPVVYVY